MRFFTSTGSVCKTRSFRTTAFQAVRISVFRRPWKAIVRADSAPMRDIEFMTILSKINV